MHFTTRSILARINQPLNHLHRIRTRCGCAFDLYPSLGAVPGIPSDGNPRPGFGLHETHVSPVATDDEPNLAIRHVHHPHMRRLGIKQFSRQINRRGRRRRRLLLDVSGARATRRSTSARDIRRSTSQHVYFIR